MQTMATWPQHKQAADGWLTQAYDSKGVWQEDVGVVSKEDPPFMPGVLYATAIEVMVLGPIIAVLLL